MSLTLRHTRPARRVLFAALALVASCPAAFAARFLPLPLVNADPETPLVLVTVTETGDSAHAQLVLRAFDDDTELDGRWKGIEVYLDRKYAGYTKYQNMELDPGSFFLELEDSDYRSRSFILALKGGMRYELEIPLERKAGWLAASVFPADAEFVIGGSTFDPGVIELHEGSYTVQARRFGYTEKSAEVAIADRATSTLSIILTEAPFEASTLELSRGAFNPRNAGIIGRTSLSFKVTSYGSASLEVRDLAGNLAFRADFPALETWEHSATWDGRLPDGSLAPDGSYAVRVGARAAPGLPAGLAPGATGPLGEDGLPSFVLEGEVRIDSSLVVEPMGAVGGSPGLLFFGDPRPLPPGTMAIDFSLFAGTGESFFPIIDLGFALTLGRVVVSLDAATGVEGSSAGTARIGAGILVPLLASRKPFSAAARLEGGWTAGTGAPPLSRREGFSAGLSFPLAVSAGAFVLGLEPLGGLTLLPGESPGFDYGARGAAWLSGPRFAGGLSGAFRLDIEATWTLDAALEGRLVLGDTPLVLHGGLYAGFVQDTEPEIRFFAGLGLLF